MRDWSGYDRRHHYGEDSDESEPYRAKPTKRMRTQGNRRRIITSTEDAADRPKGDFTPYPRALNDRSYSPLGRSRYQSHEVRITGSRPTYPKFHRRYVSERTLQYYDLPWEISKDDPDYIVVLKEMDDREAQVIFEHSRRLRGSRNQRSQPPLTRVRRSPSPRYRENTIRPPLPYPPPPAPRYYETAHRPSSRSVSRHSRRRRRSDSLGQIIDRRAEVIEVLGDHRDQRHRGRKQADVGEQLGRSPRRRGTSQGEDEARVSDAEDEEETDAETPLESDDGSECDFDLSFLPSLHTSDSAENDMASNGSTGALLFPGHGHGHATRHVPYHEKCIMSTRWSGSTFDDSPFGAVVTTLASPPIKSLRPMLRWVHLERSMPSFEEFSSVAQEVLDVAPKDKRHVGAVLRKLQRLNEQPRQQGRDMEPFCEADLDIEQSGGQTRHTNSICALSIPFFSLEKTTANQLKLLSNGTPEHPSRPLVQSHTRILNEARELKQAVATLQSTPQNHYLHVSQLWCLVVNNDTLVTCSKLPVHQLSNTLSFTEIAEKASDTYLRLRVGHTRHWQIPASIASSLPTFVSMITDRISNLLGTQSELEMKYHGKSVRFDNWKVLLDDVFRAKSELVLEDRVAYYRSSDRSRTLQHLKGISSSRLTDAKKRTPGNEPSSGTAKQSPLPSDEGNASAATPEAVQGMMIFLHSCEGSNQALSDVASSLHQALCSAQHKLTRRSYLDCAESDRPTIDNWLAERTLVGAEQDRPKTSKRAHDLRQQKIVVARLALQVFDFFWPAGFDHVATRMFWGALQEVLTGETFFGSGAIDKARDLDLTRDLVDQLVRDIYELTNAFTVTFANQEAELHTLPEQFYKAWLHFVSIFTIAAKAKLISRHDDNWTQPQEQSWSFQQALSEGELLLTLRLRKNSIEDFEVCSSRGIVALTLDCVTRDLMNERPDVPHTYSDYCRQLEARIVAEPLSRAHQETLRALQQEIDAITAVLAQQLEVVTYFESSLRDLDCDERLPDLPMLRNSRQDLVLRHCKANISSRIDQFQALQGRATELGEWHMSEIDTNKDRQEAAIMVFTIVTIIFLPLSFVSSVFGMNTEDIRDMTQGQWAYWAAAVPLTIIVVGVSMWFAGAFDHNVKSWFVRSAASPSSGTQGYPIAGISEVKPRLCDEKPELYRGTQRRSTYPTKSKVFR